MPCQPSSSNCPQLRDLPVTLIPEPDAIEAHAPLGFGNLDGVDAVVDLDRQVENLEDPLEADQVGRELHLSIGAEVDRGR